jgi:hypothetical protein
MHYQVVFNGKLTEVQKELKISYHKRAIRKKRETIIW